MQPFETLGTLAPFPGTSRFEFVFSLDQGGQNLSTALEALGTAGPVHSSVNAETRRISTPGMHRYAFENLYVELSKWIGKQ